MLGESDWESIVTFQNCLLVEFRIRKDLKTFSIQLTTLESWNRFQNPTYYSYFEDHFNFHALPNWIHLHLPLYLFYYFLSSSPLGLEKFIPWEQILIGEYETLGNYRFKILWILGTCLAWWWKEEMEQQWTKALNIWPSSLIWADEKHEYVAIVDIPILFRSPPFWLLEGNNFL